MGAVVIHVDGVDAAIARLSRYEVVARAGVAEAQAKAANDTTTLAKRLCPVDTGRLRSSIRPRLDAAKLDAEVYTDVYYAEYVEFGTVHMQAEPFLRPAWETIRPFYIRDVVAALREAGKLGGGLIRDSNGRFVG